MGNAAEKMSPQRRSAPQRIAVVLEDSAPNRRIVSTLLQKLNFDVKEASNGKEGLARLEECKQNHKKVELIMSDVMMPLMDGFQFLEEIRKKDDFKMTPFVFVTSLANNEHIKKAQNLKANGYILKPIVVNQLLKKLTTLFPDLDSVARKIQTP